MRGRFLRCSTSWNEMLLLTSANIEMTQTERTRKKERDRQTERGRESVRERKSPSMCTELLAARVAHAEACEEDCVLDGLAHGGLHGEEPPTPEAGAACLHACMRWPLHQVTLRFSASFMSGRSYLSPDAVIGQRCPLKHVFQGGVAERELLAARGPVRFLLDIVRSSYEMTS